MLQGDGHQGLIAHGVAHFAGPLLLEVDGDRATALNYSLIMRREDDRFYLWRVSAVRWDVERANGSWRVRRRTNRLLDSTGAGRHLFADDAAATSSGRTHDDGSSGGKGRHHHRGEHGARARDGRHLRARGSQGPPGGAAGRTGARGGRRRRRGAIAMRADVTKEEDVVAMVGRAVEAFGHVDIMCNNAAAPGTDKWIWEQELENWNATIAIDVTAAMLCTREVLKQSMLERQLGRDPELLVDGGLQRHRAKDALRDGQGVAPGLYQGGRPRSGFHTASGATASCPEASTPSSGRTGSAAWPASRASTTTRSASGCFRAARCAPSPRLRMWPIWPCSWPATRAGPSPGSRSRSTPGGTCRDEHSNVAIGGRVTDRHDWRRHGPMRVRSKIWRRWPRRLTASATTTSPAASTSPCPPRRSNAGGRSTGIRSPPLATSPRAPTRIRFATSVLVLPYHHPLEIAKRYGTLDKVSNGRVILGVGVGTLKEEFDLIGAPFDDRGPRSDDALRALRASLSKRVPEYHGPFYDFEGLVVDPCAVQEHVPIWVGGRTLRSLRRAVAFADGWCPFSVPPAQAAEWLQQVDVPPGFEVVLPPTERLDSVNEPSRTQEVLGQTAALGATIVMAGFATSSLEQYLERLEALASVHASM